MTRRAARLAAAVAGLALATSVPAIAGASSGATISLSTGTVAPGQSVVITGSGWPVGAAVSASICGADAVAGTTDCATTAGVSLVANTDGDVWARMVVATPPQPCPCVVLATSFGTGITAKFPVSIAGAATAPVPPPPTVQNPDIEVHDLNVVRTTTLASAMGASVTRTVELLVVNAGPLVETPRLTGRWGHPTQVRNVISMPRVGPMPAGSSKTVQARFTLPALSMGVYTVQVTAQVVGFANQASATTSTTQYPVGLFVLGVVLIVLVLLLLVTRPRRRRRRRARRVPPSQPSGPRRLASSAESESRSAALSGR